LKKKNIDFEKIIIYQNGKETSIDSGKQTLIIEKNNFTLRFYGKKLNSSIKEYHKIRIASFENIEDFKESKIGKNIEDVKYFGF